MGLDVWLGGVDRVRDRNGVRLWLGGSKSGKLPKKVGNYLVGKKLTS